MCSSRGDWALPQPGFPIQKSRDQSSLAAPPGLSQLATSFVGARCHWHPPCALVRLISIILRPIFHFFVSDKIATGLNNLLISLFSSFFFTVQLSRCAGRRSCPQETLKTIQGMETDSQFLAPLALFGTFVPLFSSARLSPDNRP